MDSDVVQKIQLESIRGLEPTDKSDEALALRKRLDAENAELKAKGMVLDVPSEWPNVD